MSRRAILDVLERLAFAAELLEDERARTWSSAAWAIRNLEDDVVEMYASGALRKVRGLGASTLSVVDDVLSEKKPAALAEAEALLPSGLFTIRRIKGLGPKKIKRLWRELSISTLGELEYACRENRLAELSGFGKKTQENVLMQIAEVAASQGRMRRDQAERHVARIVEALAVHAEDIRPVGQLARGMETVDTVEILITCEESSNTVDVEALARRALPPEVVVNVHFAAPSSVGASLVWWTCSEGHARALAARADELGMRLDEAGLWDAGGEPVCCSDEDAFYAALGLSTTPRERRDDEVPLVRRGQVTPDLVSVEDLRGALHNHTRASDGTATLEEMRVAAEAFGLSYLGISEHSVTAFYAKGLDDARLVQQREEIESLNRDHRGCVLLTGVESDILDDGRLDYDEEILAGLDVIVASVHQHQRQSREEMTRRMVAAVENPFTDVIGHPTGRLLLARAPSEVDVEALLDACAQSGCAVELNANPHRLDLDAVSLAMAKERGVLVAISADAHATAEFDNLRHGIALARRAGLRPEDVLNALELVELEAWLQGRRERALRARGVVSP